MTWSNNRNDICKNGVETTNAGIRESQAGFRQEPFHVKMFRSIVDTLVASIRKLM